MLALSFTVSRRGQQREQMGFLYSFGDFLAPKMSLSQLGLFASPFPHDSNSFQNVFSEITHALWENPKASTG